MQKKVGLFFHSRSNSDIYDNVNASALYSQKKNTANRCRTECFQQHELQFCLEIQHHCITLLCVWQTEMCVYKTSQPFGICPPKTGTIKLWVGDIKRPAFSTCCAIDCHARYHAHCTATQSLEKGTNSLTQCGNLAWDEKCNSNALHWLPHDFVKEKKKYHPNQTHSYSGGG